MKNTILLIGFLLSVTLLQAQSPTSAEWTTLLENDQVVFEKSTVRCANPDLGTDHQRILLQVKNKTNQTLTVTWLNALYYDGVCLTCDKSGEYTFSLTLPPAATISGACDGEYNFLNLFQKDNIGGIPSSLGNVEIQQLRTSLKSSN